MQIAAGNTPKALMSGFAYYLAETANLLDAESAAAAFKQSVAKKMPFISYILESKLISSKRLAYAVAEYYRMPLFDIEQMKGELIPKEYLNNEYVKRYLALPIYKAKNIVHIATIDPTLENLNEFSFLTGGEVRFVVVDAAKLAHLISGILDKQTLTDVTSVVDSNYGRETGTERGQSEQILTDDVDSPPVVKYLNNLIKNAIDKRASDIHFEKFENTYRVRYRIDGILHLITEPPVNLAKYLLARIKIMANLDITEHRIPLDGRFQYKIDDKHAIDFRVSTLPTLYGEKIVIRLLNPAQGTYKIEQLGMTAVQQKLLLDAIRHTQGMILVTGPTGSGKTGTLYASIGYLNSIEKNILTVEDPVEIPMLGVNQVHVNMKTGLTFSVALRAFLRQDPDIIMVGEIRDKETAEIAVRAAQTGHLVLSTLHTNSAIETITRMINIGIEPHNLASSIILVIAQRLARTLCPRCKRLLSFSREDLLREGFEESELDSLQIYGPVGCEHCMNGFKGRTGIFEVVPITERMANAIVKGDISGQLKEIAKEEGLVTLRRSGLNKVKEGLISIDELNRVFY